MQPAPKNPKAAYGIAPAPNGFAIQANGATLKTPARYDFIVPAEKLAVAITEEWQARGDKINPAIMPLTQLAATAIDITGKERGKVTDQLLAYIGSELLCHRAEEPPALVKRQHDIWQPILDWCETHFDDVILKTGTGIMPIRQPDETYAAMRDALERYDTFALTILRQAVDVSGSLILGLALMEKHMSAAEIFEAAELDSSFQMEKWGEDPAAANRRESVKNELAACERWLTLL